MQFTDIFIKKPVLAWVVSLVILALGLRAAFGLTVREFPETQNATISVTTAYFGASPEVIAGFITAPLEQAIAQAQGIDYISSSSSSGVSVISATLKLNYDANKALAEITAKVSSVSNQLPPQAQQPSLAIASGESVAAMYMGFVSETLPANQITDYIARVVQPKIQTIRGVQNAELIGGRPFALRAWLDPQKMAAVGITGSEVQQALRANNYLSALGKTQGQMVTVSLNAGTDLHSLEEFRQLIVKNKDNALVRLEDIANVTLGSENYDINVLQNGRAAVFIGITVAPDANILDVLGEINAEFPAIKAQLPAGLIGSIGYDASAYVQSSIDEVKFTLLEALLIVTVVIFLFIGSVRSVIIPIIAIPLSLIGSFFIMLMLGYTINLLTLLALVLAIGLVVDDAIIVVENVDRHMKLGLSAKEAAFVAARELFGPIISISVVLIAVYVPIGFQGGLSGVLFSEFAFTLAGAVAISAIVALTLSPMLCAYFFKAGGDHNRLVEQIDKNFAWFTRVYHRHLNTALNSWKAVVTFGIALLLLLVVMFQFAKNELAPQEDQNSVFAFSSAAPTATIEQMRLYSEQVYDIVKAQPEINNVVQIDGVPTVNQGISLFLFKPWEQRSRNATELQNALQTEFSKISGANIFAFQRPSLPGSAGGLPVQFVVGTTEPLENLYGVATEIIDKAEKTGKFYVIDSNLKIDSPQTTAIVDKEKAAALGLTMQSVGADLSAMLGGEYVNYFSIAGRAYKVIPQVAQAQRLNPEQLGQYYLKTANGNLVAADTVVSLSTSTVPQSIARFQQLNSVTISGVYGGTQGEALKTLQDIAKDVLPANYTIDYSGESRQFIHESGGFITTLLFAMVIIYLVLAAQFESFKDPIIVMMSVPMAIFGAMIFVFEDFASLNIYTKVGLVTLAGLIAKHGILIVQFANELQAEGLNKRQAVEQAASVRLRPILMTTAAMVLGVAPLVFASGAGAVGRNQMGLVISTGIAIGTLFTLFVVPAMYMLLASDRQPRKSELPALGEQADTAIVNV